MTAALHLAHVHQPPPGPKRKRKRAGLAGGAPTRAGTGARSGVGGEAAGRVAARQ